MTKQCKPAASSQIRRVMSSTAVLLLSGVYPLCNAAETVEQVAAPAGHTIWKITQPVVNKSPTEYPQIVFKPGQTVVVTGSGCVQTGGKGHTWKRYVDPAGDNSASLYHGEILIPGAIPNLQFFQPRQPTVYTIPASTSLPAAQMHLTLGYTDNNLTDNGYMNRNTDDGNMSQCWGLGDAAVLIDISSTPATVAPPATANYTLTLTNVTIRNLRSRHSDTDLLGAAVVVDGTESAIAKQSVGDWQRGAHAITFPIVISDVTPTDRVDFLYAIVNAGNPSDQKIDDAITGIIGPAPFRWTVYRLSFLTSSSS